LHCAMICRRMNWQIAMFPCVSLALAIRCQPLVMLLSFLGLEIEGHGLLVPHLVYEFEPASLSGFLVRAQGLLPSGKE